MKNSFKVLLENFVKVLLSNGSTCTAYALAAELDGSGLDDLSVENVRFFVIKSYSEAGLCKLNPADPVA